jgi:hypothetical protein
VMDWETEPSSRYNWNRYVYDNIGSCRTTMTQYRIQKKKKHPHSSVSRFYIVCFVLDCGPFAHAVCLHLHCFVALSACIVRRPKMPHSELYHLYTTVVEIWTAGVKHEQSHVVSEVFQQKCAARHRFACITARRDAQANGTVKLCIVDHNSCTKKRLCNERIGAKEPTKVTIASKVTTFYCSAIP